MKILIRALTELENVVYMTDMWLVQTIHHLEQFERACNGTEAPDRLVMEDA